MVFALSENEGSARRRSRTSDPFLSPALGKSLRPMAREYSGLVHQAPGVVGTSHARLVCEIPNPKFQISNSCRPRAALRSGELGSGGGHARSEEHTFELQSHSFISY